MVIAVADTMVNTAVDNSALGNRSVERRSRCCIGLHDRHCHEKILWRALLYDATLLEHNDMIIINNLA